MKRIILSLLTVLLALATGYAQSPEYIPYQAVASDASGNLLVSQSICMQFRVYNESGSFAAGFNGNVNYFQDAGILQLILAVMQN